MSGPWGPAAEMKNMFNWRYQATVAVAATACPDESVSEEGEEEKKRENRRRCRQRQNRGTEMDEERNTGTVWEKRRARECFNSGGFTVKYIHKKREIEQKRKILLPFSKIHNLNSFSQQFHVTERRLRAFPNTNFYFNEIKNKALWGIFAGLTGSCTASASHREKLIARVG